MVDAAIRLGIDLDGRGLAGLKPALSLCAERNDSTFLAELLRRNTDPNIGEGDDIPVFAAARKCNLIPIKLLADAGADLGIVNSLNETLLHVSISHLEDRRHSYKVPDIVEYLLGQGVNPRRLDHRRRDAEDVVEEAVVLIRAGDVDHDPEGQHYENAMRVRVLIESALENGCVHGR